MPIAEYKRETLLHGKSLAEYYIVFKRSELAMPFIDRDYSHVYAVKWDGYFWQMINPALGYTDIFVLPCFDPDIRVALAAEEYTDIIKVSAWRKIGRWRTPWPMPFTCVEQIKALLGISSWWILTPRQLYKYLGGANERNIKQA